MIALLERIADDAEEAHPILGSRRLEELRRIATKLSSNRRPAVAATGHKLLAYVELTLGNPKDAERLFAEAEPLASALNLRERARVTSELKFWRGVVAFKSFITYI